MLDLDRNVVRQAWMLAVKGVDQIDSMLDSVEEVWVTKCDVLGAHCNLATDVFQHDVRLNDTELPVVYRNDRAMAALVFAPAARLSVAHRSLTPLRHGETGVPRKIR